MRSCAKNSRSHKCVGQRYRANSLSPEREKCLNAIGFIWDPFEHAWEKGFAALAKFKAREGHCGVPRFHVLEVTSLDSGLPNNAIEKPMCRLGAKSDSMRLDLSGTPTNMLGNKDSRH